MPEVEISEQTAAPEAKAADSYDIARNWGATQGGRAPGRSAKKRQQQVQNLVRRMQAETRRAPDGRIEGPLRPCTVVNFNPVALVVEGQLRITVPKPGTTPHHQIRMPYKGRVVQGHYCYLASPMMADQKPDQEPIYYTVTSGHEVDSILPIDVPTVNARVFSPHSIACELWSQYNSPSHKLMGGILMFDQSPHTLKSANLERTQGRIWVPVREQMEDEGLYTYRLRETTLEEELDRIFEVQRDYCDVIIQKSHTLWAEQDITSRKMVTDTDREWARWAVSMGYLSALPEWVNAKLVIGGEITELHACKYCGTQQPNATVFFCQKCNAPYDAYKAFKAGLHVPEGYLMTLEGEELEDVLRTLEERKRRFAALHGDVQPPVLPDPAPVDTTARAAAAPVQPQARGNKKPGEQKDKKNPPATVEGKGKPAE